MAKLKDILKEFIGELPSSKLKKMKWNPVTEAPMEVPAIDEPATDVLRLQKKFGGILDPIIKKINTKDELHQAVEMLISQVEANKPGLAKKAKILLKKTIMEL